MLRLYDLPTWLLAIVIIGPIVGLSNGAMLLTRRWVRAHCADSREVVSYFFTGVGTIYAVLLAMIAVAAWENYSQMDELVTQEASEALNVYRDMQGLPRPFRDRVRGLLAEYVRVVIEEEWPEMRQGRRTRASDRVIDGILTEIVTYRPTEPGESVMYQESFQTMNRVLGLRRKRLMAVELGLLPELWMVVLVGGFLNIGLSLLIATKDIRLDLILTTAFSLMIGIMVFLIFALDHPFWGEVSVKPEAFEFAKTVMSRVAAKDPAPSPAAAGPLPRADMPTSTASPR
ncbi:MAG TPA: DUF4239 domain-containing protein [Isosphaeraceae bacterium]|jgi:hypothetical protein